MKYIITISLLMFSLCSFSGEDPRKKEYLDYLNKNGYEGAMKAMVDQLFKKLPIKSDAATTIYSITFFGTQLTYKSYFDLKAFNQANNTNFSKSDFDNATEEKRYIQGRVDSICRNEGLRPAIRMGMHVTDIVTWSDSLIQLHRTEIFDTDCKLVGL